MSAMWSKLVLGLALLLACQAAAVAADDEARTVAAWQALDEEGLLALTAELSKGGDAGQAQRAWFVKFVEGKFLQDPAALRALKLNVFSNIVACVAKDLPAESHGVWVGKIRQAYFPAPESDLVKGDDIFTLMTILNRLGDKEVAPLVATWIVKTDGYRSCASQTLYGVSRALGNKPAFKEARRRLAAHLGTIVAGDDLGVTKTDVAVWSQYAFYLGPELSAEEKAAWAKRLRAVFAPSGEAVASLSPEDFASLTRALGLLGEKNNADLQAQRDAATDWKALEVEPLAIFVNRVSPAGKEGTVPKKELVDHLTTKFMADDATARAVTTRTWKQFTVALVSGMSSEAKATWAARLRSAFLTAPAWDELQGPDAVALNDMLKALGDKDAAPLLAKWLLATKGWQSSEPGVFYPLCRIFGNTGHAEARLALAEFIEKTYQKDDESVRLMSIPSWGQIISFLRSELSPAKKAAWATALKQTFAGSPKAVAELTPAGTRQLQWALQQLGDKSAANMQAVLDAGTDWKSLESEALATFVGRVCPDGKESTVPRKELVEHITARFMADEAAVRSAAPRSWQQFAARLGVAMSPETKAAWTAKLHAAYLTAPAWDKLDGGDGVALYETLKVLGDKEAVPLLGKWIVAAKGWHTSEPVAYYPLCRMFGNSGHQEPRRTLAAFLEQDYLKDAAAVRQIDLGGWVQIIGYLASELSPESKQTWARKFRQAYAGEGAAAKMTREQAATLVRILQLLGDKDPNRLLSQWSKENVESLSDQDLARTAQELPKGDELRPWMVQRLATRYLADSDQARNFGVANWAACVKALLADIPAAERSKWAAGLKATFAGNAAALSALNPAELMGLMELLGALDDRSYPQTFGAWMATSGAWRQGTPRELAGLVQGLKGPGGADPAAVVKLAADLDREFSTTKAPGSAAEGQALASIAAAFARELPAAQRADWAKGLRQRLAGTPPAVVGLEFQQLRQLLEALTLLDDKDVGALAAAWVGEAGSGDKLAPADLGWLLRQLPKTDPAAMAARRRLVDQAGARYLTSAASAKSLGLCDFKSFLATAAADLPKEQKAALAARIRTTFLAGDQGLAEISPADFVTIVAVMTYLEDGRLAELVAAWMKSAAAMQNISAADLALLVQGLRNLGPAGQAPLLQLADFVAEHYLRDQAAAQTLGAPAVGGLLKAFGDALPEERRLAMLKDFRAAFTSRPEELAKLTGGACRELVGTLKTLGDPNGALVIADWVEALKGYDTLQPGDFYWIARDLPKDQPRAKAVLRAIINQINTRYLTSREGVREVGCVNWSQYSAHLGGELLDIERAEWIKALRQAYFETPADWAALSLDDFLKLTPLLRRCGDADLANLMVSWCSGVDVLSTANLHALNTLARELPSDVDAARKLRLGICEQVESRFMTDPAAMRQLGCQTWANFVTYLNRDMTPEQKAAWIAKLRGAFGDLSGLGAAEADTLVKALVGLGDPEVTALAQQWVEQSATKPAAAETTGKSAAQNLVSLVGTVTKANPQAMAGLMSKMEPAWQEQYERRTMRWTDLRDVAAAWQRAGNLDQGRRWAVRAWSLALAPADGEARLDKAGETSLAGLLNTVGLGRELERPRLAVLFLRTISAAPGERAALWSQELAPWQRSGLPRTESELPGLEQFMTDLRAGGSLTVERALVDLLRLSRDGSVAWPKLSAALDRVRLQDAGAAAPAEIQKLILQAQELTAAAAAPQNPGAETATAVGLYGRIIEQSSQLPEVARLARRLLIPLLLAQENPDLAVIAAHLQALPASEHLSAGPWNWRCRLLLRRVMAAGPETRPAAWASGLTGLRASGTRLSAETIADLDKCVAAFKGDRGALPMTMLTDLLLLGSDIESMRRLQWRRVALFREWNALAEAQAAAALDVILAGTTAEGPLDSGQFCLEIAAAAGRPAEELAQLEAAIRWGGAKGDTGPAKWPGICDTVLKSGAADLLKNGGVTLQDRERGYLNLLAGNWPEAAQGLHAALCGAVADGPELSEAFDDLAVGLAVAEGGFQGVDRFARWRSGAAAAPTPDNPLLAELVRCDGASLNPPVGAAAETYGQSAAEARAGLARSCLRVSRDRQTSWGLEALRKGQTAWAAAFWTMALAGEGDESAVKALLDDLNTRAREVASAQGVSDVLTEMAGHMPPPLDRYALTKAAGQQYDAGEFAACLKTIEAIDKTARSPQEKQDLAVGFVHVSALIGLGQLKEAGELLARMREWPGTGEDQARVLFTMGWIHLQQDDRPKALALFKEVGEKYPQTSLALRARKLADGLGGN